VRGRSSCLPSGAEFGIFLFFVAAAYAMLQPLPGLARTHTADLGYDDPYLNAHFTRVTHDFLLGLRPGLRLLDADFFYPHPLTFTTTDPCIGLSVLLLPLRAFTDDYLLLINLGLFFSFPLAAHAMYLFVRDASGGDFGETGDRFERSWRRAAGILAGLLYAFSAYRFHQLDHPGLEQTQWLPYLAWALLGTARKPRFRQLFLLVPLIFETFAASSNLALYVAPAVAFLGFGILATAAPKQRLRFLAVVTAALVVAAVPLVPIYAQYIQGVGAYAIKRGLDEVKGYSATPNQLLAVPKFLAHWGSAFGDRLGGESATFPTVTALTLALAAFLGTSRPGNFWNRPLQLLIFPGFLAVGALSILHPNQALLAAVPLVALGAVAFVGREKDPARIHAFLLATLAVLYGVFALGPRVTWEGVEHIAPWDALMKVPGFASVRTPSRFWFVVTFAIAALAGLGFANLASYAAGARRWLPRQKQWLTTRSPQSLEAGLAIVVPLVLFGTLALEETRPAGIPARRMVALREVPAVYGWVRDTAPQGALLELPLMTGPNGQILERKREYFANVHKRPVVGGESGVMLASAARVTDFAFHNGALGSIFEELHAAGLRTVLLHPGLWEPADEANAISHVVALGGKPGPIFDGVKTYLLPPPRPPVPFAWTEPKLAVRVNFDGTAGAKATMFLGNTAETAMFSRGIFTATLRVELVGGNKPPFEVALPVAPPMIAAFGSQYVEFPLPLDLASGRYDLRYTVRFGSDAGPLSATKTVPLYVAPRANEWPPAATCTITKLAAGLMSTGTYRSLVEVITSDRVDRQVAWVASRSGRATASWVPSGSPGARLVAVESPAPVDDLVVFTGNTESTGGPLVRCGG
jgi:hypothetical protein